MIFDNEQKRAINHLNGPLLVIAGPGAGKTATMIERLAHMITCSGIDSDRILVITFSRAASMEMKERFEKRMKPDMSKTHFGTFHSVFLSMLKHYFSDKQSFNLISDNEKRSCIYKALNEYGFDFVLKDFIDEFLLDVTLYKNSGCFLSSYKPISCDFEMFTEIYARYESYLQNKQIMDFDDIIILTNDMLTHNSEFREYWQNRYDYILIDEFQDINSLQFSAVNILAEKHKNIFAVGDEDQSIYGFRGSNPDIMMNFQNRFPDASVIYLSNNYRSSSEIVNAAGNLIQHNVKRYDKKIISANEKAGEIKYYRFRNKTEQLKAIKEVVLNDKRNTFAILCRTNSEKDYYINSLNKRFSNVNVLTMHESKGLEFDCVWIPDVCEGLCPYCHKIYGQNEEEERRLFYVAVTRAKTKLFISYCTANKGIKRKKSRFIKELKST